MIVLDFRLTNPDWNTERVGARNVKLVQLSAYLDFKTCTVPHKLACDLLKLGETYLNYEELSRLKHFKKIVKKIPEEWFSCEETNLGDLPNNSEVIVAEEFANHDDYTCDICQKEFRLEKDLEEHVNEFHYYFKCSVCNERFKNQDEATKHYISAHQNDELKKDLEIQKAIANRDKVCQCGTMKDGNLVGGKRKVRCKKCTGCLAPKCKKCIFCVRPSMKKPCEQRKCLFPIVPKCPCFTETNDGSENSKVTDEKNEDNNEKCESFDSNKVVDLTADNIDEEKEGDRGEK